MPYYGATYYATYNPHNYYGQGDPVRGGSAIGTIIGLCCFCCIFAIICMIVAKGSSGVIVEEVHHDDGYGHLDGGFTTEEIIHNPGVYVYGGPNIEILNM